ncbi:30S ribosomal protein S12e [Fonticula alba]|uniref:40S ribosomal protein S12 n=1 Tax=Fonticula alba TaxID=691883 RepID=A0A058ZE53_FONAL|nr:30S ribosomal protein S12e [Fonticula alba]KCV72203.1 30S ribosomal protein S12e [Fonticula alba]|eukprot:XP_009493781.1 30S ribosomal protein S12e [Fonticula alba]
MSEVDVVNVQQETVEVVEEVQVPLTIEDSLHQVLKTAMIHGDLARGLRETTRALSRGNAHFCVLAEDCDEKNYVALIEALCAENKIHLIKVPEQKRLGEMVGLCKIDREGNPRKVVRCSSAVVVSFGVTTPHSDFLMASFASSE